MSYHNYMLLQEQRHQFDLISATQRAKLKSAIENYLKHT